MTVENVPGLRERNRIRTPRLLEALGLMVHGVVDQLSGGYAAGARH